MISTAGVAQRAQLARARRRRARWVGVGRAFRERKAGEVVVALATISKSERVIGPPWTSCVSESPAAGPWSRVPRAADSLRLRCIRLGAEPARRSRGLHGPLVGPVADLHIWGRGPEDTQHRPALARRARCDDRRPPAGV